MGSNKGKQLFCRRCEGHGAEVILKGHGAFCPYIHCKCDSCERLRKMRENAFIRRYKSTLSKSEMEVALNRRSTESRSSTSSSSDENTETEFSPAEEPQPFSFEKFWQQSPFCQNEKMPTAFPRIIPSKYPLFPKNTVVPCPISRREFELRPAIFPLQRKMAPTVEPVVNANGVIPGLPSTLSYRANPQQPNMISELPNSAQRDILNVMLQAQNFNQSGFDPQQLAHIQNMQQQQQQNLLAAQQATVTSSQNQVHQNGSISPPKLSLPLPMSNQMVMRQKRPSQPELFPMNEPINKRSIAGTFPQGGNYPLQQLVSMNNPQQMALLQQVQQTNMPTSSSIHMSPMGVRAPSLRVPFPSQGFSSAFNPTSGILSQTDDALQNYIRNMQTMPPPPRGQMELAQIMSLINANNQSRLNMNYEEMKRKESLPQLTGLDQNAFAQQFALRQNVPQQQQQQQLMQMAALAQQQNEQRKRSMSFTQSMATNQMAFSLAQFSAPPRESSTILSNASMDNNLQTPLGIQTSSPNKETNHSTPSVSDTNSIQSGSNNGIESRLGSEEMKYQMFLHSIELFNKKIIDEHNIGMLSEKLDIPAQVVEAAWHTHLAKILVPSPTISLDEIQPGWQTKLENVLMKNVQTEVTNSST